MASNDPDLMEKIVSLAKRRGFIYQGSEIYGGLGGMWDYGPLGVELKNNVKNLWWRMFVQDRNDMFGLDAAILMNARTWEASGHVEGFADPMVECEKCHHKFRADQLPSPTDLKDPKAGRRCPDCGGKLGDEKKFNMMFKTQVGASEDSSSVSYLRPETAQGMFVNFKNVVDSFHPKLPFGLGQIGKAFRNEITPRDFIFRVREFEQMEVEYFTKESDWKENFEKWRELMWQWIKTIGLDESSVHELEVADGDRAHYSKRTIDFEFDYPFGRKELYGLAYRTDYDLKKHQEFSGQNLEYLDEESGKKFLPHVIEPSLGVDRTVLAILLSAYREDEMNGEKRAYLAFSSAVAPVKVAVFPLLKNKPELVAKAREIYEKIKRVVPQAIFDDNGNIGKRYRRQDEIGTPYCVTVDFDTLGENSELEDTVTLRDRDTGEQKRVKISELIPLLSR